MLSSTCKFQFKILLSLAQLRPSLSSNISVSVINGKEDPIDIQLFDIEKCFDSLWVEECVNDLYESGLQNDKLPLLYLGNQNAKIAVKSQTGMSKRKDIHNIIMQG